jgi:hypothetical protein
MPSFTVVIRKHIVEEAIEIIEAETPEKAKEAVEQWFLSGTEGQIFFEPVEDDTETEFLVLNEDGDRVI